MKNYAKNCAEAYAKHIDLGTFPVERTSVCGRFQELTLRVTPEFRVHVNDGAGYGLKNMGDINPKGHYNELRCMVSIHPITDRAEAMEGWADNDGIDCEPNDLWNALEMARLEALSIEDDNPEFPSTCCGPTTWDLYNRMTTMRSQFSDDKMSATIAPSDENNGAGEWFLYWTDHGPNDWHEILPNQTLANARIAELIFVVSQDDTLSPMATFLEEQASPAKHAHRRMQVMLEGNCYGIGLGGTATTKTQRITAWQCVAELLAEQALNPSGIDTPQVLAHMILTSMHG
jgi:hypothetical protein